MNQSAIVTNTKRKIMSYTVCAVLLVLSFVTTLMFMSAGGRTASTAEGRVLVLPGILFFVSMLSLYFALTSTHKVSLNGALLTTEDGPSKSTIDLKGITDARLSSNSPNFVLLKDAKGELFVLGLKEFKSQDISWLHEPLLSAINTPGVIKADNAAIRERIESWFKA